MKERQYNLILRKPEENDVILATGSINFVEAERLNQIFKKSISSENLIIEEIPEEVGDAEIELSLKTLIGLTLCVIGLLLIKGIYGKK